MDKKTFRDGLQSFRNELQEFKDMSLSPNNLLVKLLDTDAIPPKRAEEGAAGYDIYSLEDTWISAKSKVIIKTGVALTVPVGTYGRIAPRSGLAAKHGIDVGAGVIDRSYTGEIRVILFNHGYSDYHISKGDRIAQLILEKIKTPGVQIVQELPTSSRGSSGFGSSGK
jgi:dUTP pyrophosphatase